MLARCPERKIEKKGRKREKSDCPPHRQLFFLVSLGTDGNMEGYQ
jgi:hypothetical protein